MTSCTMFSLIAVAGAVGAVHAIAVAYGVVMFWLLVLMLLLWVLCVE